MKNEKCRIVGLGAEYEKCEFCNNHSNIMITFDNIIMYSACNKCVGPGKLGEIVNFYGNKKLQSTFETPYIKFSILIDNDGNFKVKIRDEIKSNKFSYYDDAYHFLSDEMIKFFRIFEESIKDKQYEILKKKNKTLNKEN
jgi:hypothetical protein